jgi:octaprenyl-diphosphate synthase
MTSELKQRILLAVGDDLAAVENALKENLNPHVELVGRVAGHILFAGGKRLRPLLMILTARLCQYSGDGTARSAAIFEYLHAATLLHDDVVDGGRMRRGRAAAHEVWDAPTAVLTGDFLLARALTLAAQTRLPEVIQAIAAITEYMSQGEIRQMAHKGDLALSEAVYLDVIRCKTAVLFEGACRVGALLARAPEAQVKLLGDFGHHLGMAFQMADDLLDYTQESAILGKRAGADLREGKLTLPVIRALQAAGHKEREWMAQLIGDPGFKDSDFARLVQLLEDYGGIDYTRRCAQAHIGNARRCLSDFPPTPARDTLHDIAAYAITRVH